MTSFSFRFTYQVVANAIRDRLVVVFTSFGLWAVAFEVVVIAKLVVAYAAEKGGVVFR